MEQNFYAGFEKQARVFAPLIKRKGKNVKSLLSKKPKQPPTMDYSKINKEVAEANAARIKHLREGGGTLDYSKFK